MASQNTQEKQGFTIIEVLLVLAIAGLIFLMIFIAWPALNRTQRDARRRDDISLLLGKIKDYQTNNRGALPVGTDVVVNGPGATGGTSWSGFYHDYLGDNFTDPDGPAYKLVVKECGGRGAIGSACAEGVGVTDADEFSTDLGVRIVVQASCDGEKVVATSNPRKLAVQYKMEGGGVYCADT